MVSFEQHTINILSTVSIAYIILFLVLNIRKDHTPTSKIVLILLGVGTIGYLSTSLSILSYNSIAFYILLVLPFSLPVSFWLFSKLIFDDQFVWNRFYLLLFIGNVILKYILLFSKRVFVDFEMITLIGNILAHSLSLIFTFLALFEAFQKREEDLVNSRRRFRKFYFSATAALFFFTIIIEIALGNTASPFVLEFIQKSTILLSTFLLIIQLHRTPELFPQKAKEAFSKKPRVSPNLVNEIITSITKNDFYKTEGLTISQFAERLGEKEYRVRQAINQELSFKNFSAFLNHYRIQEAQNILARQENNRLAILEIAYSLGYQSLAPFNKAFKSITGLTPTNFRKAQNAD